MTCRFELEFKGEAYPRSCPRCQFGPCKNGYTQIKNEGKPGYKIQAPNGQINSYGPEGQPEGAIGVIGVTGFTPQDPPGKALPVPNTGPLSAKKRVALMAFFIEEFSVTSMQRLEELVTSVETLTRD